MHVSSTKGWGNHFKQHNNYRKENMNIALECVVGTYRNVIQLLILHYIIQPKVLVNSEKEKRSTYSNKIQNTIPAPHSFMHLMFLASKLMTFRWANQLETFVPLREGTLTSLWKKCQCTKMIVNDDLKLWPLFHFASFYYFYTLVFI